MDTKTLFGLVFLLAFVMCIPVSIALEKRRRAATAGTKPYTWGIYVGLVSIVWGLGFLAGAASNIFSPSSNPVAEIALGAAIGIADVVVGYYTIQRRSVAFVLATVLSFNPIWWIINAIYGSKRWDELEAGDGARRKEANTGDISVRTQG
jgi:hypothetical protein